MMVIPGSGRALTGVVVLMIAAALGVTVAACGDDDPATNGGDVGADEAAAVTVVSDAPPGNGDGAPGEDLTGDERAYVAEIRALSSVERLAEDIASDREHDEQRVASNARAGIYDPFVYRDAPGRFAEPAAAVQAKLDEIVEFLGEVRSRADEGATLDELKAEYAVLLDELAATVIAWAEAMGLEAPDI